MAVPAPSENAQDRPSEENTARVIPRWPARLTFVLGAVALLTAMVTDTVAVAGRHLGAPLLGSIEIVQTAMSIAGSSSIVGATLMGFHASIHVLTDRVSPSARLLLLVMANLLAAIFFAILSFGCAWIAWDLHDGQELTELLSLPLLPFRIFVSCAFAVTGAAFAWRACRSARAS